MRRSLLFVSTVIFFSSCSQYQYFTVASENIPLNDRNEFVYENDTLRIIYDFWGESGPVGVTVYNKTNNSLQVDWKRSAVIIGEKSVSYFSPDFKVNGEIESKGSTIPGNSLTHPGASLEAMVAGSEEFGFIPPHSSVTRNNVTVARGFIKFPAGQGENVQVRTGPLRKNVYKSPFTKNNSPLIFRSYLTFLMGKDAQDFAMDHSFYINGSFKTGIKPVNMGREPGKQANTFYVRRISASRTSAAIVVSALLIVGAAAIE